MPKPWLDEDWGYEDFRQQRLDSVPGPSRSPSSPPPIIGSALPASAKIQRSSHRDPDPNIPFVTVEPPFFLGKRPDWLLILYLLSVASTLGYALYLCWGG